MECENIRLVSLGDNLCAPSQHQKRCVHLEWKWNAKTLTFCATSLVHAANAAVIVCSLPTSETMCAPRMEMECENMS
jgi:hypothetical protein